MKNLDFLTKFSHKVFSITAVLCLIISSLDAQTTRCGSSLNLKELQTKDPAAYKRLMDLEKFTNVYRQKLNNLSSTERLIDPNAVITIPIVVHVIHNGTAIGAGRNIPTVQITNQIRILNEDYRRLNQDRFQTPNAFSGIASDPIIEFRLACKDPNGNQTDGIDRVTSSNGTTSFSVNPLTIESAAKHTNQGGIDAWPTDRYLNIWVCNLTSGLLGAATFPSNFSSNPNIDGVMVNFEAFGSGGNTIYPFNLGRTATHEIGHWLNLKHIWGDDDGACSGSDECDDTPNQGGDTPTNLTPIFPNRKSCGNSGDMFMNYMDYSADRLMNIFTNDQRTRMRAVFQTGEPRSSFIDNYFSAAKLLGYSTSNCNNSLVYVKTPFCEAFNNIIWSVSGPATFQGSLGVAAGFALNNSINGTATVTASWNNLTTSIGLPTGYGGESSSYSSNCYNDATAVSYLQAGDINIVCPNRYIQAYLGFTGATGPISISMVGNSGTANFSYYGGSSFNLYFPQQYSSAQIRATIPTACGTRTADYYFYANIDDNQYNPYYRISPNPASSNVTISAAIKKGSTTERIAETYEYEVQVFNSFGQMLIKKKNIAGAADVDIDVSRFPSNQFYTVKLISGKDVQTQKFFKQ